MANELLDLTAGRRKLPAALKPPSAQSTSWNPGALCSSPQDPSPHRSSRSMVSSCVPQQLPSSVNGSWPPSALRAQFSNLQGVLPAYCNHPAYPSNGKVCVAAPSPARPLRQQKPPRLPAAPTVLTSSLLPGLIASTAQGIQELVSAPPKRPAPFLPALYWRNLLAHLLRL